MNTNGPDSLLPDSDTLHDTVMTQLQEHHDIIQEVCGWQMSVDIEGYGPGSHFRDETERVNDQLRKEIKNLRRDVDQTWYRLRALEDWLMNIWWYWV